MTKTLLSTALVAVLGTVAFAPQAAHAVDGTITFTGQVNATTCQVGAGSPVSIAVALPTVSTTALSASGQLAGYQSFNISVTKCAAGTKATTYFEQGQNTLADGNLKNTAVGGSNAEVRLFNSDQATQILLNAAAGAQQSQTVTTNGSGAGTLNYWAAYYAPAAATAGAVSTSVQFTMQYQ